MLRKRGRFLFGDAVYFFDKRTGAVHNGKRRSALLYQTQMLLLCLRDAVRANDKHRFFAALCRI